MSSAGEEMAAPPGSSPRRSSSPSRWGRSPTTCDAPPRHVRLPRPVGRRRWDAARVRALGRARLADRTARRLRRAHVGLARDGGAAAHAPRLCDRPAAFRLLTAARAVHARPLERARPRLHRARTARPARSSSAIRSAPQSPFRVAPAAGGIVLLDGDALPGGGGPGWATHLLQPPWFTSVYRVVTGSDWIFRRTLRDAWGPHAAPARRRDGRHLAASVPHRGDGGRLQVDAPLRDPGRLARDAPHGARAAARRLGRGRHGRLRRRGPARRRPAAHAIRARSRRGAPLDARGAARRRPGDR